MRVFARVGCVVHDVFFQSCVQDNSWFYHACCRYANKYAPVLDEQSSTSYGSPVGLAIWTRSPAYLSSIVQPR